MKLSIALLSAAAGLTSAKKVSRKNVTPKASIKSDSNMGKKMLSKARRLDENQNNNDNGEIDFTWVAQMSLKFQGCHSVQEWNEEADGDEDLRIATKRLVRFRLCPSTDCSMESAYGCKEGYGDYVMPMEDYLEAYFEAVEQDQEYNCEYEREYGDCAYCENANDDEVSCSHYLASYIYLIISPLTPYIPLLSRFLLDLRVRMLHETGHGVLHRRQPLQRQ